MLRETIPFVDHSLAEEMLPEVESGVLFRNLQAVASGLVSSGGEVEKLFTG